MASRGIESPTSLPSESRGDNDNLVLQGKLRRQLDDKNPEPEIGPVRPAPEMILFEFDDGASLAGNDRVIKVRHIDHALAYDRQCLRRVLAERDDCRRSWQPPFTRVAGPYHRCAFASPAGSQDLGRIRKQLSHTCEIDGENPARRSERQVPTASGSGAAERACAEAVRSGPGRLARAASARAARCSLVVTERFEMGSDGGARQLVEDLGTSVGNAR